MSQFYKRYIPSSDKFLEKSPAASPSTTEKRKRQTRNTEVSGESKRSKRRKTDEQGVSVVATHKSEVRNQEGKYAGRAEEGNDVLNKYSISRYAKSQNGDIDIILRKKERDGEKSKSAGEIAHKAQFPEPKKHEDDNGQKYSAVLHKYDKSKMWSQLKSHNEADQEDGKDITSKLQPQAMHDLVPIPQPQQVEVEPRQPTFSTLPAWQTTVTSARHSKVENFDELGLSDKMIHNLRLRGITNTFPIQSTVIPLLIEGDMAYNGDICVSAATGSGKTLAYIIPVIESLKESRKTGLRAVIVVPTRELVKQVREMCEICAAGTSLQIVTTLGSKSLHEEQRSLIEEELVHDPEAFAREMNAPIDWTTFSLEKMLQKARQRDLAKTTEYVTRTRLKADILITTPGRLVDHLQNTEGFHLDDVKWLVVDEADRLLNESYQDWIDVVVPALESRRAMEERDKILSYMRMDLPPRIVRKVLLSATMTRDISKLNSAGLNNPKLIVLDASHNETLPALNKETSTEVEEPTKDALGKYVLPVFLQETAVTFKEGADKPILLLRALTNEVGIVMDDRRKIRKSKGITRSSDSESESSDSDSDLDDDSGAISSSDESGSDSDDTSSMSSMFSTSAISDKRKSEFHLPQRRVSQQQSLASVARCLIFTRSTASASRLSRLLSIMSPSLAARIGTLTRSTASSSASRKALSSFRSGKTPILIATDRASRGIDVPGLEHVISYDIPGSALTYVHRVGRTARAGKKGNAWTLVEHREGKWFWSEIGGKSDDCIIQRSGKVKKLNMSIDDEDLRKRYDEALQVLGTEVRGQ